MEYKITSIEQMSQAMNYLIDKVDSMEASFKEMTMQRRVSNTHNEWMNILELCEYLPTHPARQTVYEWVKARTIPFHKTSKMLTFNRAEIDKWLHGGFRKTIAEIEKDADDFIDSRHK